MESADQFDIVIRHAKGQVYAAIPQLSLFARGETAEAALKALDSKKQEVLAEARELGEPPIINVGATGSFAAHNQGRPAGDVRTFTIKVAIATFIVAGGIALATVVTAQSIRHQIAETKIGGRAFWTKVEQQIVDAAKPEHDLPPERKARLLNALRTIVDRWRPFAEVITGEQAAPKSGVAATKSSPGN